MYNDKITIIVSVYNELASLPELLQKISHQLGLLPAEVNCIISDDGSTDETVPFLQNAQVTYPWLSFIHAPVNCGKSNALKSAIDITESNYIIILDGDLQNDPKDFLPLYQTIKNTQTDCVAGWRKFRKDDPLKNILSRIYNTLINIIFDMDLHDHNCGMKIFRKDALSKVALNGEWHRYITVLLFHAGFKVTEMEVIHHPRPHGKSRYGINRYIRFFMDLPPLMKQIKLQRTGVKL